MTNAPAAPARWWPSDYLDESMPDGRPSPDDWIAALDDGAPALVGPYGEDSDKEDMVALADGETVSFSRYQGHGQATLILDRDGSFSVDLPMPAQAECVWVIGDVDTLDGDVENLAACLHDAGEVGLVELEYYSFPETTFRFDAATRAFVAVPSPGEATPS